MNFRSGELEERYRNDPTFYKIVQAIHNMIAQHGITPSEIREAVFLAHYKYEMENPYAMQTRVFARMANFMGMEEKNKEE